MWKPVYDRLFHGFSEVNRPSTPAELETKLSIKRLSAAARQTVTLLAVREW